MRKNLIPLLAVALVIAGLCTVIFYGLIADRFSPGPTGAQAAPAQLVAAAKLVNRGKVLEASDLRVVEIACPVKTHPACFATVEELLGRPAMETMVEGQPVTDDAVAKRKAGVSPSAVIPVGMRAVTLHAADSKGVVEMIRSGDRVDLQVIGSRDPNAPLPALTVQRVWTNIEVLGTLPPDPGSSHNGRPVITVLMAPADAERLSLADTTSRIRVVLRNREEVVAGAEKAAVQAASAAGAATPEPRSASPASAALPANTRASNSPVSNPPVSKPPVSNPPVSNASIPAVSAAVSRGAAVQPDLAGEPNFLVRLVSVQPDQLAGLGVGGEQQPQVRTVARRELEDKLSALETAHAARILGSRPVAIGLRKETLLALGADGQTVAALGPGVAGVRFRMRPLAGERWRLEPEAQTGEAGAATVRRSESEASLSAQEAWLVSGLLEHKEGRVVLPGQGGAQEPKLLLVVTPIPR